MHGFVLRDSAPRRFPEWHSRGPFGRSEHACTHIANSLDAAFTLPVPVGPEGPQAAVPMCISLRTECLLAIGTPCQVNCPRRVSICLLRYLFSNKFINLYIVWTQVLHQTQTDIADTLHQPTTCLSLSLSASLQSTCRNFCLLLCGRQTPVSIGYAGKQVPVYLLYPPGLA